MAILVAVLALMLVTAAHETGHFLAVRLKRGRVLRVQVGRGPVLWSGTHRGADILVSLIPVGGRIHYDDVPGGSGEAVVAASGAVANLALAFAAFAAAAWALGPATPLRFDDAGAIPYAAASTGAWFWAVPGALVELVASGSAVELRRAVRVLIELVVARPLHALPYAVGALSSLWAALNLIPLPVIETDGWHVARALWRGARF
jgi:membrane-associated protease RseP (regulator of RpoE activity)